MTKDVKLNATADLVHPSQLWMLFDNNQLLLQTGTPLLQSERANDQPTSNLTHRVWCIEKTIVMQLVTLIKRSYIPKYNDPSHSPTIFVEKK